MTDNNTQYDLSGTAQIEVEVTSNHQLTHEELQVVFDNFVNVTLYKYQITKGNFAEYSNQFNNKLPDDIEMDIRITSDDVTFGTVEGVVPTTHEVLNDPEERERSVCPHCGHVEGDN